MNTNNPAHQNSERLLDAMSDAADHMNQALVNVAAGDTHSAAIAIANAEMAVDNVQTIVENSTPTPSLPDAK